MNGSLNTNYPLQSLNDLRSKGVVAVLMGGKTSEREISLQSGHAVAESLSREGFSVEKIDTQENIIDALQSLSPDFAFIALHGGEGENGTVQALLELLGIRYSGSGVSASALAMDKLRTKHLWRGVGLPTPDFVEWSLDLNHKDVLDKLGGHVFVKPVCEGSSFGMSMATTERQLHESLVKAKEYQNKILIEQFIEGPEYTVGMLGQQVLPSIRIETDREFYDFQAKYQDNDTGFYIPSGLSADDEVEIQQIARKAFNVLGCRGWGRVDLMRHADTGQFYLLEVNTVPGLTSHSLVPMAAKFVEKSFAELVTQIISASLEGDI